MLDKLKLIRIFASISTIDYGNRDKRASKKRSQGYL